MNKLKIFLTVLSVLITVIPIGTQVFIHRDNLVGLVIPSTFNDLLNTSVDDISTADSVDIAGFSFQLPVLLNAEFFFHDSTVKMLYTFTNPLDAEITLTSMDAEIICVADNFILGSISIEPTHFDPNQTLEIPVTCVLSRQALEHIAIEHQGQDSIKTEFKNFSVELIGVKIHIDTRKLGDLQINSDFRADINQMFR